LSQRSAGSRLRAVRAPAERLNPTDSSASADLPTETSADCPTELLRFAVEQLQVAERTVLRQNAELVELRAELDAQRARHDDLFTFAPVASVVTDRYGKIEEANLAFATLVGQSVEHVRGTPLAAYVPLADRRPFRSRMLGLLQSGGDDGDEPDWELRLKAPGGDPSVVYVGVTRRWNGLGQVAGLRWLFREVTERKLANEATVQALARERRAHIEASLAQQRLTFLAQAGQALTASLDDVVTLETIARLALPMLGDWCAVDVAQPDGTVRRVVTASPGHLRDESSAARPLPRDSHDPIAEVIRTGRSRLIRGTSGAEAFADCDRADDSLPADGGLPHPEAARLIIPLAAGGRVMGALSLVRSPAASPFSPTDVSLAREYGERAGLALERARVYREMRDALASRNDFLTLAAHELKTPITSMRGYAQLELRRLARRGSVDPEELGRVLAVVDLQSQRLARLVAQILAVAELDGNSLVLHPAETNLTALVTAVLRQVTAECPDRRITLDEPGPVWALVDAERLGLVLHNLLDNAVRYSPDGGPIEVALEQPDRGTIRLTVRDYGLGIEPERRAHLFDRFYRAHADALRSGLGLGLYVSQQLVQRHGGTLTAEFPADGGTRVALSLPTRRQV
jgi:PAS domain S-box-containing protein